MNEENPYRSPDITPPREGWRTRGRINDVFGGALTGLTIAAIEILAVVGAWWAISAVEILWLRASLVSACVVGASLFVVLLRDIIRKRSRSPWAQVGDQAEQTEEPD